MKAKNIVCLILAILMVLGTAGWSFSMVASAADTTTATSGETVTNRLLYVYAGKTDAKSGKACYDSDPAKGLNDFAIRSGRFASFRLNVTTTFETEEAAQKFKTDNSGSLWATMDSGSFELVNDVSSNPTVSEIAVSGTTARYTVAIDKVLYNGIGNTLGVTVYYTKGDGYSVSREVTVSQCIPYEKPTPSTTGDDSSSSNTIPDPTPYVIVSGYEFGGTVTAGQEFVLKMTIKNTSPTTVGNMTMTVGTPDALTLVDSSNTLYIDSLTGHGTFSKDIRLMARPNADPAPASLEVRFVYQYVTDGNRKDVDRTEKISIPIVQRDRFTVDQFSLPASINVGEEYDLQVKYMNKGRSAVYNMTATVEGDANLVNKTQSENVGNVESGKSGTLDFFLQAKEPCTLTGNIVITYEDANMKEQTIRRPYSIEVNAVESTPADSSPTAGMTMDENGNFVGPDGQLYDAEGKPIAKKSVNLKTFAIAGGSVLAGIIVIITVAKKRKAARLMAELEEDNHEDL
mgnify:CR=1 FL=1